MYVYLNPFGHWDDQARPIRLNGTYDSMFGMTVSNIGDLDQDGYGGENNVFSRSSSLPGKAMNSRLMSYTDKNTITVQVLFSLTSSIILYLVITKSTYSQQYLSSSMFPTFPYYIVVSVSNYL